MGYSLTFNGCVPRRISNGGSNLVVFLSGDADDLTPVDWNVTYNFSKVLNKAFAGIPLSEELAKRKYNGIEADWGLWRLDGKSAVEQKSALETAIAALSDEGSDDYWSGSERAVKEFLKRMLAITSWWIDARPGIDVDGDEYDGTWCRHAY